MRSVFDLTYAIEAHACVAHLVGDIDVAVVPDLRGELDAAIDADCVNLVLDLNDVSYVDSSALGLLVWLDHRLRPVEGRVVLVGANPDVSRILELSGLSRLANSIAMSETVDAALARLEPGWADTEELWRQEICIPADLNRLAAVRDQVSDWITPLGLSESAVFDIKVALGEALANAVRHGAPPVTGRVCIDVRAFGDRVVVEVSDNGAGFNGVHAVSEDLYAPSGRGIMFMRALMDRVEFEPADGGGTLVRLTKRRAARKA